MSNNGNSTVNLAMITPLLIIGVGIGCLVGLSVSPVVGIVITSVTGSAAAVVSALGSLEDKSAEGDDKPAKRTARWKVNPWPLAALVVGLLMGSIIGVLARNNHWFGSDSSSEITKWTNLGIDKALARDALFGAAYPLVHATLTPSQTLETIAFWKDRGVSEEEVVQKLFEKEFGGIQGEAAASNTEKTDERLGTFLFAVSATECESLTAAAASYRANADSGEFIAKIRSSTDSKISKLPEITSDPAILQPFIDQVLCARE
jgi:hypothetical protein